VRLLLIALAATAGAAAVLGADSDLSPEARARAAGLGRLLPQPRAAFSSPARCALQTADALDLRATAVAGLADWDLGRFAGWTIGALRAERAEEVRAWQADPGWAGHGGESLDDLLARATAWLTARQDDRGTVAAVTHGAVIRAAAVVALAVVPRTFWALDVAPCSVTELSRRDGRWHLARLNWEPALLHIPQRRGRRRHRAPARGGPPPETGEVRAASVPRCAIPTSTRVEARLASGAAGGTVDAMNARVRTLLNDVARAGQVTRRRARI
jgi:broad specificity phosphatase PhoE